jgi:hypothetical protein
MPTRLSRISACFRRFAGRESLTLRPTIARLGRARRRKLTSGQLLPHKSIVLSGDLPWTRWYSNSWGWRCWRFASSCWPSPPRGGHPDGASGTTDASFPIRMSCMIGRSRRGPPGGLESARKFVAKRKCKARIRPGTLDISALSAERRFSSVMDRSWI